ncbi:LysR family substrate-binding domain-containing protein [Streptomyces sp. LP05-1]|uniref:LysR family substrate-binding domain-containing protein n=1 Tax=Streptomyces pyxinae TaxID=2970734 RepID=A0ABT2CJ57_9ACTN|nr:LysR family substrate-binding domain-containing protein [Streptomyces sp. LP05-1]MCS0637448.1 LysR family substrate-binding domain-containing protein [Streptomyces sp. LP05-1]
MTGSEAPPSFRLAYVPGATPAKWVRVWNERLPGVPLTLVPAPAGEVPALLLAGDADAGLVRLPVDRTRLSAIPLYTETTVVLVPKDHAVAAVDEVAVGDLADDIVFSPLDETLEWERPPGRPALERPATTGDAVELVAAGVGLLVVPQSLARLHHRRDLTYRPVTDAPRSSVALSWPEETTTDLVEEFIGIVRGRTANSTRGRQQSEARAGRTAKSGGASGKETSGGPGGKDTSGKEKSGQGDKARRSGASRGKPASRTASGRSRRTGSGKGSHGATGRPRRRS